MARRTILTIAAALVLFVGSGCARHVHHHHPAPAKTVAVLEGEHDDRKIVVVHTKPHRDRVCWKHRRHWHCRR